MKNRSHDAIEKYGECRKYEPVWIPFLLLDHTKNGFENPMFIVMITKWSTVMGCERPQKERKAEEKKYRQIFSHGPDCIT